MKDRKPNLNTIGIQFFREGRTVDEIAIHFKKTRIEVEGLLRKYVYKHTGLK
jgi:hypothetical protein